MRREAVAWERAAEVRQAADGWLRAGAIDAATREAIRRAYPDPRVTPSAVWRALTAAMVSAVVLCSVGAVLIAVEPDAGGLAVLLFLFGGAALVATERLEASPPLASRGAAGAAAFWGTLLLLAGLAILLNESLSIRFDQALDAVLLAGALAWAAACWRWGHPLFAGCSALSLFVLLGRWPHGRVLCVLVGTALAGLAARRTDAAAWAPSHRRAALVLLLAGVIAVYAAVNLYSLDEQWFEALRPLVRQPGTPALALRLPAAVATAVVPLAALAWGYRSRRTALLDAGIALLGLTLVTLRYYVHLAPLWVALTVSGGIVIGLALAIERALRRSPRGEIAGFTADALFADERRSQLLRAVPAAAAFTPAASAAPAEDRGFAAGGGRFGGGGASGKF